MCWFFSSCPFPPHLWVHLCPFLCCTRLQAADPLAVTLHLPAWQSCILLDYSSCRLLSLVSGSSSHQASVIQFPSYVPSAPWWEWLPSVSGSGHLNTPHYIPWPALSIVLPYLSSESQLSESCAPHQDLTDKRITLQRALWMFTQRYQEDWSLSGWPEQLRMTKNQCGSTLGRRDWCKEFLQKNYNRLRQKRM